MGQAKSTQGAKKLLRESIELSDAALQQSRKGQALQVVIHIHLLALYELASGVLKLNDGHAFQTFPLLRSMLEITTNLRWILLADMGEYAPDAEEPQIIAARFMSWEAVDAVALYKKWQAPNAAVRAKLETDREAHSAAFAYERDGRTLWAHWAVDRNGKQRKTLEMRMADVREADRRKERAERLPHNPTNLYTVYSTLSSVTHLSPKGVHHLFEVIDGPEGRRRRRAGPSMPGLSFSHTHACLLTALACCRPHFPLNEDGEAKFHELWSSTLADPDWGQPKTDA